jgi:hypothetical protein
MSNIFDMEILILRIGPILMTREFAAHRMAA